MNLLSRLQELAVLGANDTNTTADHRADLEAEAIGDEFNRLMTKLLIRGMFLYQQQVASMLYGRPFSGDVLRYRHRLFCDAYRHCN